MGKPTARNLLKEGYSLVVQNRTRGTVESRIWNHLPYVITSDPSPRDGSDNGSNLR